MKQAPIQTELKEKPRLVDLPTKPALVVIDVQKGFDDPRWGRRNNPQAESNIRKLLEAWRSAHMPVIHTQHCSKERDSPLRPGNPGNEIKEIAAPRRGEPVLRKTVNSAFIGTRLDQLLRKKRVGAVVLVGLTTDHCVSTTARMAANMGFVTYVVSDATATFDRTGPDGITYGADEIQSVNLASLHKEFATVIDTESLLKKLTAV
jgi:nicotinamidase-related amidase